MLIAKIVCEYKKLIVIVLSLQIKLCWKVDGLYKSTAQRYKTTEDFAAGK